MAISALVLQLLVISGCAVVPKKLDNQRQDTGDFFERRVVESDSESEIKSAVDSIERIESDLRYAYVPVFSPGDTLRIQIYGMSEINRKRTRSS